VVTYHANATPDRDLAQAISAWLDPTTIDELADPPSALLHATCATATGALLATLAQLTTAALTSPRPPGAPTSYAQMATPLLRNPALQPPSLHALLAVADMPAVQAWLNTTASVTLHAAEVALLHAQSASPSQDQGDLAVALLHRLSEPARPALVAKLNPSTTRAVAAQPGFPLELLTQAPSAEAVLLKYHDPVELYDYLEARLTPDQIEMLATLVTDFAGSLSDLIAATRACTEGVWPAPRHPYGTQLSSRTQAVPTPGYDRSVPE
jgi:hypothetical protein